ncbi:MAG: NTP transferase domain-containing protein [Deltaproteobacteria bacterium]|nr:NTP transferase domain-containing protein [Deltaproteobacteria bacterium]
MTRSAQRFAALITAAGASSRMGRPKALVAWRGAPLLLHQARVLAKADGMGEIVAVLGGDAARIRGEAASWTVTCDLRLVDNPRWAEGRSTSLEAGVAALRTPPTDALLIVAVDQPLVPEVVAALLAAWAPDDRALVPSHAGRRGHPVMLAAALLPELARASRHPEGLRDIVRAAAPREVEVASDLIHLDLNDPDAVARAHRQES